MNKKHLLAIGSALLIAAAAATALVFARKSKMADNLKEIVQPEPHSAPVVLSEDMNLDVEEVNAKYGLRADSTVDVPDDFRGMAHVLVEGNRYREFPLGIGYTDVADLAEALTFLHRRNEGVGEFHPEEVNEVATANLILDRLAEGTLRLAPGAKFFATDVLNIRGVLEDVEIEVVSTVPAAGPVPVFEDGDEEDFF